MTVPALVTLELHWARPLDEERCLALLRRLASDALSHQLVLEVVGTESGVRYYLSAAPNAITAVTAHFADHLPGTQFTAVPEPCPPLRVARQLRATSRHRQLRTDAVSTTARTVLGAVARVRRGERLVLQVILGPRRVPLAIPTQSPSSVVAPWWYVLWHGHGGTVDSEKRSALRAKVSDHGFACAVRIGSCAPDVRRAQQLVTAVFAALRTTEAPGLLFRARRISTERLRRRQAPLLGWPLRFNVSEVLTLLAWPVGDADLPGQPPLHPKRLPPAAAAVGKQRVVAESSTPGRRRTMQLTSRDALTHTHLLGPTGVGKSELLGQLITQDIAAGHGLAVIEPKGDLVDAVLQRIPPSRVQDVVVLDPSDPEPVGLNPLSGRVEDAELRADAVLSVFKATFGEAIGPRSQDILHASLLTLATHPSASLVMLPLLLTNAGYRRSMTARLNDPIALGPFWQWYESIGESGQAAVIAPVMNKLRAMVMDRRVRAVLGQRTPKFDVADVFTKRKILLVPLRTAVIGEQAARLIGSLAIAQLWQHTQGRARIPVERRRPVHITIDEVQNYLALPTDIGEALAQARGYGVGFTLAHQFLDQLGSDLRRAVLTNARSRIYFRLSPEDAARAAKGHPEIEPEDFTALGLYEVYASLYGDGTSQPYALGRTLPLSPATSDPDEIRQQSRSRYGQPLSDIEDDFAQLVATASGAHATPTGRRRRP